MEKVKVFLEHPCYECHEFFSNPQSVINHMKKIHGIEISKRPLGKRRPTSKAYFYEKQFSEDYITHYACPSCWFHCSANFDIFSHHMVENHVHLAENVDSNCFNEVEMKEEPDYSVQVDSYVQDSSNVQGDSYAQDDFYIQEESNDQNEFTKDIKNVSTSDANQDEVKAKHEELLDKLEELVTNLKNLFN